MRRTKLLLSFACVGAFAVAAQAQTNVPRIRDLPKMTQSPVLDGDRFTTPDEWTNADERQCSPSQVQRDGAQYGWLDVATQQSAVSVNQLGQSDGEDAGVAKTDQDIAATFWTAYDDDGIYYVAEVADNVHDVTGSATATNWWERDSISLYLDLLNEDTGGDAEAVYTNLNIINFVAAPENSSSVTRTLETTVQQARVATQDADQLDGLDYGYTDRGNEFGGIDDADYCIEGKVSWSTLVRGGNLPAEPAEGAEMGYAWIILDPDGDDAFGGQIQCEGWAAEPINYATWVFTNNPAGPGSGTAVQQDSWGRIKATF